MPHHPREERRRRKACATILAASVLLVGAPAAAQTLCDAASGLEQPVASSFQQDGEGWTIEGDAGPDPRFDPGEISASDQGKGVAWYWVAPAKFHGDQAASYGLALTYRLRVDPAAVAFGGADVFIEGSGLVLTFEAEPDPGLAWTDYSVALDGSAGWQNSKAGRAATPEEICQVLANVTALKIRGEYRSGPDTGWLGGVVLGAPLPLGDCVPLVDGDAPSATLTVTPAALFPASQAQLEIAAGGLAANASLRLELWRLDADDGGETLAESWSGVAADDRLAVTLPDNPGRYLWRLSCGGTDLLALGFRIENPPGGAVVLLEPPAYAGAPLVVRATLPEGREPPGTPWVGLFDRGAPDPLRQQELSVLRGGESEQLSLAGLPAGEYEMKLFHAAGQDHHLATTDLPVIEARFDRQVTIAGPTEIQLANAWYPLDEYRFVVVNDRGLGSLSAPAVTLRIDIESTAQDPIVAVDAASPSLVSGACLQHRDGSPSNPVLECRVEELAPGASSELVIDLAGLAPGRFTVTASLSQHDTLESSDQTRLDIAVRGPREALFLPFIAPRLAAGDPPVATVTLDLGIISKGSEADRAKVAVFGPQGSPMNHALPPNCPPPLQWVAIDEVMRTWIGHASVARRLAIALCETAELQPDQEAVAAFELHAPAGWLFAADGYAVPAGLASRTETLRVLAVPVTRSLDELHYTVWTEASYLLVESRAQLRLVDLQALPDPPGHLGIEPGRTAVLRGQLTNVGLRDLGAFDLRLEALWTRGGVERAIDFGQSASAGGPAVMLGDGTLACAANGICSAPGLRIGESLTLTVRIPTAYAQEGSLLLSAMAEAAGVVLLPRTAVEAAVVLPDARLVLRLAANGQAGRAHEALVLTLDAVNFGPQPLGTVVVDLAATRSDGQGTARISLQSPVISDAAVCQPVEGQHEVFARCTFDGLAVSAARILSLPVVARHAGGVGFQAFADPALNHAASAPVEVTFQALPGDTNDDGKRDCADLTELLRHVIAGGDAPAHYDVNGDEAVDQADVVAFYQRFPGAQTCGN